MKKFLTYFIVLVAIASLAVFGYLNYKQLQRLDESVISGTTVSTQTSSAETSTTSVNSGSTSSTTPTTSETSVTSTTPTATSPTTETSTTSTTSTSAKSAVTDKYWSTLGILRSTDHGKTWESIGDINMEGTDDMMPVDPTPAFADGKIVLFFVDLAVIPMLTLYRSDSTDGVNFSEPKAVYTQTAGLVDPFVLKNTDGTYRFYIPSEDTNGIISGISKDGTRFTREAGTRTSSGGMPGALIAPDGRVRLFVSGQGITSLISDDGVNFTKESGVRIMSPSDSITDNPEPIRLSDGTYLMLYSVHEKKYDKPGIMPWEHTEIRLATSEDGHDWTVNTNVIGYGGTSCVVEASDGTLYIYYVTPVNKTNSGTDVSSVVPIENESISSAASSETKKEILKFEKTIKVAPDTNFLSGGFTRINYVPANDNFIVTFGGEIVDSGGTCPANTKGYSYKEYTLDMQETGKSGTFSCDPADAGSVMVGNDYYHAAMTKQDDNVGWHLKKIDVSDWTTEVDKNFYIDYPKEGEADPMVAYANGELQLSSAYSDTGKPPGEDSALGTYGTFHYFFDSDLNKTDEKILTDAGHINGMYMTYVNGIYYLVSASLYFDDIVLMEYDKDWKFISSKTLIKQANWSTGLIYDGTYFYMSYEDTSQRNGKAYFPVFENVHLAIFDKNWNLLQDIPVTDYSKSDNMQTGRPWVIKHKDKIYVSYDVDTRDPITHEEDLMGQAYVSIYELAD